MSAIITTAEFEAICKEEIALYFNDLEWKDPADGKTVFIGTDDVYCVWLCKTLQNIKGLFSTTVPDTRYYELTYNGDKDQLYLDVYLKEKNICIECGGKLYDDK